MTNKTITFQNEGASAILTPIDGSNSRLHNVQSKEKGLGHGRRIMESVVKYADAQNLTLHLIAQGYGNPRELTMDNVQLVEFYKKFGFKPDPYFVGRRMIRHPQNLQSL